MILSGKAVKCIDTGEVFVSINRASRAYKIDPSNIKKSIKLGVPTGRVNYRFEWTNELEVIHPEHKEFTWINRELTLSKLGYLPEYLHPFSYKKVYVRCSTCNKTYLKQMCSSLKETPCKSCNCSTLGRSSLKYTNEERAEIKRKLKHKYYRENRAVMRIRGAIRSATKRKGLWVHGALRHLDYTSKELKTHITKEVASGCCICGNQIKDNYHIAHIIPLSYGDTFEEIVLLNALVNLSVAHPECNISQSNYPVLNKITIC